MDILVLVIYLVVFGLTIWWLAKLLKAALHSILLTFGDSPQVRILGLAVATLLVPQTVLGPWNALFGFAGALIQDIPASVIPILSKPVASWSTSDVQRVLPNISMALQDALSKLNFPLDSVILGLGLWVLIGQLLSGGNIAIRGTALFAAMKRAPVNFWQDAWPAVG